MRDLPGPSLPESIGGDQGRRERRRSGRGGSGRDTAMRGRPRSTRASANLRVDLEIHFRHVHNGAGRVFQHMGLRRHAGANRENQPGLVARRRPGAPKGGGGPRRRGADRRATAQRRRPSKARAAATGQRPAEKAAAAQDWQFRATDFDRHDFSAVPSFSTRLRARGGYFSQLMKKFNSHLP